MLNVNKRTAKTASEAVRILWEEGFFANWSNAKKVSIHLGKRGNNFSPGALRMSLVRAEYLTRRLKNKSPEYIQKRSADIKGIKKIEDQLFDKDLLQALGERFAVEIEDLRLNFGRSGNCSAFLLRKILEKLIYISFAHNGLGEKLEIKSQPGRLIGLEAMINIAVSEKVNGVPFITSRTAKEIKGIKFLGDASAHNPLVDINMETIIPQMPFIITAYKELSNQL